MATNNGVLTDGRVNSRIENYTNFWQKDMSKEAAIDTENRVDNYTDVINGISHFGNFVRTIVEKF